VVRQDEVPFGLVDADTALLFYFLGPARSFVWLVESGSVTARELPPKAEIEALARKVRDVLERSNQIVTQPQVRPAAVELGSMVLGPVADRLRSYRLVVVAPAALSEVPFAALAPSGDVPSLVVDHEIVSAWSLASLDSLRRRQALRERPERLLALIADPVFSVDDPRCCRPGSSSLGIRHPEAGGARDPAFIDPGADARQQLAAMEEGESGVGLEAATGGSSRPAPCPYSRLPFAAEETAAIMSLVPSETSLEAIGLDAVKELLLDGSLEDFRVIHIATHGQVDPSGAGPSQLVLSCVNANGQPREGHLEAREIFGLELRADLVVLSACETALAKEIPAGFSTRVRPRLSQACGRSMTMRLRSS
jgi:CHAT domain-containing protein